MEMNLGIVVVGSLCRSQLGSNQETRAAKIAVGFSRVNEDSVWNNQAPLCDVAPSLFGLMLGNGLLTLLHGSIGFVIKI